MTQPHGHAAALEDVLNEFVAEMDDRGASYELLRSWTARYPAFRAELTDLAASEALLRHSAASAEAIDDDALRQVGLDAARGVIARIRQERPSLEPARAVLPGLMVRAREVGLNIHELAERSQLSVTLIGLLDRRLIRFASIPGQVVDELAAALQTHVDSVLEY
jgi:hypothetical protein